MSPGDPAVTPEAFYPGTHPFDPPKPEGLPKAPVPGLTGELCGRLGDAAETTLNAIWEHSQQRCFFGTANALGQDANQACAQKVVCGNRSGEWALPILWRPDRLTLTQLAVHFSLPLPQSSQQMGRGRGLRLVALHESR